ncbi:hypothetical protein ACLB2K_031423 [Fragaria x ananassa]
MVMEPSLLILDEPTSGLDSSSSNLLLRALRREALEGVNICMVVHQPRMRLNSYERKVQIHNLYVKEISLNWDTDSSVELFGSLEYLITGYTLFRMFDDLILLAKGGLTVYHGSVKKVEEYFTSLGMAVPDRVNPPDYFIDILEGSQAQR